jgi:hypothetical protein
MGSRMEQSSGNKVSSQMLSLHRGVWVGFPSNDEFSKQFRSPVLRTTVATVNGVRMQEEHLSVCP